jgi:hypothetical protein
MILLLFRGIFFINLKKMNNFYVYIYLDPRKPGNFVYGDFLFKFEPFYDGKGKGDRITEGLSNKKN